MLKDLRVGIQDRRDRLRPFADLTLSRHMGKLSRPTLLYRILCLSHGLCFRKTADYERALCRKLGLFAGKRCHQCKEFSMLAL